MSEISTKAEEILEQSKQIDDLQDKVDTLSNTLVDVWKEKKRLDHEQKSKLAPLKFELEQVKSQLGTDKDKLEVQEHMLKQKIRDMHEQARALQAEAFKDAEEARAAGDMDRVKEATVRSHKYQLNSNNNVYFRTQETFEVVDPNLIPRDYLVVDNAKIHDKLLILNENETIPGVKRVKKLIVVVRE